MFKLPLLLCLSLSLACNTSTTNTVALSKVDNPEQKVVNHSILGEENARRQLKEALNGEGQKFTFDTMVKNSVTAVAIAEPLLFEVFGKQQVLSEKPYEVYLIDGYWYISGTIPTGYKGGGFEIIFSAKNGQVIRLTHYK